MCPNYSSGGCLKGEGCDFAHSEAELRSTPNMFKTALCANYLAGHCSFGTQCRFAHGLEELRPAYLSFPCLFTLSSWIFSKSKETMKRKKKKNKKSHKKSPQQSIQSDPDYSSASQRSEIKTTQSNFDYSEAPSISLNFGEAPLYQKNPKNHGIQCSPPLPVRNPFNDGLYEMESPPGRSMPRHYQQSPYFKKQETPLVFYSCSGAHQTGFSFSRSSEEIAYRGYRSFQGPHDAFNQGENQKRKTSGFAPGFEEYKKEDYE